MLNREELPQDDALPATPPRTYTGRFRIDNIPVDDNSDGTPQPPSYVPSTIARKIMKGSKRGKNKSSQGSNPSPAPTYRIIRGPPSDIGAPSRRHDGSSQMPSRSISVPSESEPPSTSVTRVPSPDWEALAASPSSSRSSAWGIRGSTSPRRRTQTSKLRNVIIAPDPASPRYDTDVEVEADASPSPPYMPHPHPHPPETPPPRVFPPRSSHPSVNTSLRHASLPPSSSHHPVLSHTRHPSLPPDTTSECSPDSRYSSVPPSTPPSLPPRSRHPSLRSSSPWPYPVSLSKNPPLRPRASHPAILPRPPPQPPSPSSSPPPLPAPAPPITSSNSASTIASTSTDTATTASSRRAPGGGKSKHSGGSGRPPTEAVIHCQWETCRFVITGIQNFGKHLKQEHRLPVVQHGRQSGPVVQCNWGHCGVEIAGLELYIHILQIHLKFGYHCRGLQKDGKSRCEYRPNRLDTLERHYKAIHPGEKRQWDETLLAILPPR